MGIPASAFCSGCSSTSVHNPFQVELQRKALLSNTLASLWFKGWWNSLRRSLVAGSIGPRFLSAARRVLDRGRLVSAASTCSDIGPAGSMGGWCQSPQQYSEVKVRVRNNQINTQPGGYRLFFSWYLKDFNVQSHSDRCSFLDTYLHSENQKLSWLSL